MQKSNLEIKYFNDESLSQPCQVVLEEENLDFLDDLREICYEENGLAIAANQVGVIKRVIYTTFSNNFLINPEILSTSDTTSLSKEGCLSIPNMEVSVKRFNSIVVKYNDREFNEIVESFSGLHSFCIQHELDHLNGITMLDRVPKYRRKKVRELAVKKLKRSKL